MRSSALRSCLMAVATLAFLLSPALGQRPQPTAQRATFENAGAVDRVVRAEMTRQEIVGLAVGILQKNRIVYVRGYGLEDREAKSPVTEKTLFRWASVSKPVTAIAAMQLVQAGKLDLDDDVRRWVPEFPDHKVKVTPRQLLCHQGGIVHYLNGKVVRTQREYAVPHPFADVVLALDNFKDSPLLSTPGEKTSYSTHAFILLSAVVERAGKQRFADQVADRIARPLGMESLQPDYQWVRLPHRAVGYRRTRTGVVRSSDTDVSWKLGGGGFISNIRDFARFAQGLLEGKLVAKPTETTMWTKQRLADGKETSYGLGFAIDQPKGQFRVSHNGAQEKTRTRLAIYPQQGKGIVLMTNCEWINPGPLAAAIEAALDAP